MYPRGLRLSTPCPSFPRSRSPRAGSTPRCAGRRSSRRMAPGINALKTFDPPLSALEGRAITGVGRRGKQFVVEFDGGLALLIHLMSAGRLQLYDKRAGPRDRTSRLLLRIAEDADHAARELRLREFGTKQAAWVEAAAGRRGRRGGAHRHARPGGLAAAARRPQGAAEGAAPAAHAAARPARHRRHRALVGRRDPLDRAPVAVQARQRPHRRGGARAARGDRHRARRRRSSTTSRSSSCRSPTSCRCRCRSTARPASRARAAARRSRPSTTRTTSCATARPSRPAARCSRTAASRGC